MQSNAGNKENVNYASCASVSIAEEMNPSCRRTMEDAHRVVDGFCGVPSQGMFGVYDGHGGRQIVDFIEKQLERNITMELKVDDGSSTEERLTR